MISSLAAFSLASCQTVPPAGGCPPLVEYDLATQRRAALELQVLPRDSAVARMIVDYKKTRDACRIQ